MLTTLAITSLLLLDDGSGEMGTGGTLLGLRNHKTIRMVSEYVYAKLPSCKVKASFVFKNEGPATTVTMAFPESGTFGGYIKRTDPWVKDKTHFLYFRSYVDGRQVKVKRRRHSMQYEGDTFAYHNWWVKAVRFKAGETKTVVDEYQGEPGWGGAGDTRPNGSFSYVFETGNTWKDKIGSGTIQIDCRELLPVNEINLSSGEHLKMIDGVATWSFKNLEPTVYDNVMIYWHAKEKAKASPGR